MVCSFEKGNYNKLLCRRIEASTPDGAAFFIDVKRACDENVMTVLPVAEVADDWFPYHRYWVRQEKDNITIRFHLLREAIAYVEVTEGLADKVLENNNLTDGLTADAIRKKAKMFGAFEVQLNGKAIKADIWNRYDAISFAYKMKARNKDATICVFQKGKDENIPDCVIFTL